MSNNSERSWFDIILDVIYSIGRWIWQTFTLQRSRRPTTVHTPPQSTPPQDKNPQEEELTGEAYTKAVQEACARSERAIKTQKSPQKSDGSIIKIVQDDGVEHYLTQKANGDLEKVTSAGGLRQPPPATTSAQKKISRKYPETIGAEESPPTGGGGGFSNKARSRNGSSKSTKKGR